MYSRKYYTCFSQKKNKISKIFVGDNVEFYLDEKTNEYVINKVLDRKNQLIRPFVTNVSQIFIIICKEPKPDLILVDKLIINAKMNNIKPIIVINKCELDNSLYESIKKEYANSGVEVLNISVKENINIDSLIKLLENNESVLAGQSGVGKTSLLNLICKLENKVDDISEKIKRGKNTTTNAELIVINNNSFVLDTAGFSKIDLFNLAPNLIKNYYQEFDGISCTYSNCNHIFEGDKCNVINNKNIDKNRYKRYKQIFLERNNSWSNRYD